ncbi:hypothetical protein EIN_134710 [Entamoeba invadens IP1]|uniref:Right handed beta helix domain-containing protein n=1 Tax=Entamoeba invadens IP1 TaxID=370355 RepID=A0A0A1TXA6_ENTIV|nr:hypothetical protein EIN_134710 [Entamoeba invadens IP1]ELP85907.1 hypothetical protein EIN_134710 [Entamoeba invadens IP1]|eukprot:XP_004185253.1 hypothetical protein EIN_134710 [Entamoeba invadens IP1]
MPVVSDGPAWASRRTSMQGDLSAISGSGATGIVTLPVNGTIYRGYMYTAYTNDKSKFYYADDRVSTWASNSEVYFKGYWNSLYGEYSVKGKVVTSDRTIVFNKTLDSLNTGMPYYAYNLIEELDEAGEYYIDRSENKLYIYLPPNSTDVWITQSTDPIFNIGGIKGLTIENLIMSHTLNDIVDMSSVSNVVLRNNVLRHAGLKAIYSNGLNIKFDNNEMYDTGDTIIYMLCGDYKKLENGGCEVTNNVFSLSSQIKNTVAIQSTGMNVKISHNKFFNIPYSGIYMIGDEYMVSYNELENFCSSSNYCSGIFSGGHWEYRGMIIKYNYLHHALGFSYSNSGLNAIGLDDNLSGATVYGNAIVSVANRGISHSSGRENNIANNFVYNCTNGFYGDGKGPSAYKTTGSSYNLLGIMDEAGIDRFSSPWKDKYPTLALLPKTNSELMQNTHWLLPEESNIQCNVLFQNKLDVNIQNDCKPSYKKWENNMENATDLMMEISADGIVTFGKDSGVYKMECWKDIPFDCIGVGKQDCDGSFKISVAIILGLLMLCL